MAGLLFEQINGLTVKINDLERQLRKHAREDEEARRLMTVPGIGHITAMALRAFAPPMETFRRGRDFAAWVGLVPRQHTTGGKSRLGKIWKMSQHDLRLLLITGVMAEIRWAVRRGVPEAHGWHGCLPASRESWSPWRWPTRWRASSGR